MMEYDDLLMCNCADCGCELLGRSNDKKLVVWARDRFTDVPPICAGHMSSRPYCGACLSVRYPRVVKATSRQVETEQGTGNSWDNVVAAMEENR